MLEPIRDTARDWDRQMREEWGRSLPFSEAASDRWQRAADLGFGDGASIYNLACVLGDVQVGGHTWIGPYTLLDGSGGLRIGAWCSISAGVHLYSHNTVRWALSGGEADDERRATAIGNRCFIGPHAVVAAGVTVADGCVVGAQAYVNIDLPRNSIAVGIPARIVGEVRDGPDGIEFRYF